MTNVVFIEGVGYCKEIVVNRYNQGVNEPYTIYEPVTVKGGEFEVVDLIKVMKCKCTWCNNETEFYNKSQQRSYCPTHYQYKNICGAASRKDRPHLMYKVEKWTRGEHQCESCGFDPVIAYPNLHTKGQSSMMDVDHINSDIKHTPEGEQPNNYQLNCKHCHIVKSHEEGDYVAKKYRK